MRNKCDRMKDYKKELDKLFEDLETAPSDVDATDVVIEIEAITTLIKTCAEDVDRW